MQKRGMNILPLKLVESQSLVQDRGMYWHIEDMIMKFLPPRNERRMSKCYWYKRLGCIKDCAALILKNPSCLHGFFDIFSRLEKFMKE
jgi:hypothetical protein